MYQLSDLALEAILKEFDPQQYDPLHTDVREWIRSIESLCDTYGIPDVQRPQCATAFVKDELSSELEDVLAKARATFGPVHWDPFKNFMVEFDRSFREQWENLPFYRRHPKYTGAALGVTGGVLLAPVAIAGFLSVVGFTSAGVAAGSIAATIQSIVYGGATGGLFSLLQSAGATMVLPSIGTILTGAAATGTGAAVATSDKQPVTVDSSGLLRRATNSAAAADNDDDENPPPDRPTVPEEYLLTPRAILAIVKAWDVGMYNPPEANLTDWLGRVHKTCVQYGIPAAQKAPCAMHYLRADYREAARTSGCYNMTWESFVAWLRQYDRKRRIIRILLIICSSPRYLLAVIFSCLLLFAFARI